MNPPEDAMPVGLIARLSEAATGLTAEQLRRLVAEDPSVPPAAVDQVVEAVSQALAGGEFLARDHQTAGHVTEVVR